MPVVHCMSSLDNCLFNFFPLFNQVILVFLLSCRGSLYILDINLLLDICFTNFSPFHRFSFHHIISFAAQKGFSSIQSQLSIFYFCCLQFWCQVQEIIAKTSNTKPFSFFSLSFTVSGFTFISSFHSEFIFVWCKIRDRFYSLGMQIASFTHIAC